MDKKFLVLTGGQLFGALKIFFFGKNSKIFFSSKFSPEILLFLFFSSICFFTAELSHFLGTKNLKKIFFPKCFLYKNIVFEFCVPKK
jgi:hypothetical protein